MMRNEWKKLFWADKFGWKYYCDGAARRQRRYDKKMTKRKQRRHNKEVIKEGVKYNE